MAIVGMVGMFASADETGGHIDTTPVTCSGAGISCPIKTTLYSDYECGWGPDVSGCNQDNCCGGGGGCNPNYIGDGDCDPTNNNAACGNYDGGDCCACTCACNGPIQSAGCFVCGGGNDGGISNGFNCQDPNTPTDYPTCGAVTCSDNEFDGNTCAGGIDAYNPGSYGNTGEECCECGPANCFDGCDPNWECVREIIEFEF